MKRPIRRTQPALVSTLLLVVLLAMSAAAAVNLWAGTPVRTMVDDDSVPPGGETTVTIMLQPWAPDDVVVQYSSVPADAWKDALLEPPTKIYADSATPFFRLKTNRAFVTGCTVLINAVSGNNQTLLAKQASLEIKRGTAVCLPDHFTFNPSSPGGGVQVQCTIHMNMAAPVPAGQVVTLTAPKGGGLITGLPPSVTVLPNQTSATFSVQTGFNSGGNAVVIQAEANGTKKRGMLDIN